MLRRQGEMTKFVRNTVDFIDSHITKIEERSRNRSCDSDITGEDDSWRRWALSLCQVLQ